MNTQQIKTILTADPTLNHILQDVCPIDRIPKPQTDPAAYIINLDESFLPGSHWIAIYLNYSKSEANYFDSTGAPPHSACKPLLAQARLVKYNDTKLQDHTMVCGQFACMFLLLRARGYTFEDVIKKLTHPYNDLIMHELFKPIFPHLPFFPSIPFTF